MEAGAHEAAPPEAVAVAEYVEALIDFYWFHHQIFGDDHLNPPPPPPSPLSVVDPDDAVSTIHVESPLHRHRYHHRRSRSDEIDSSPDSLLTRSSSPKLQTIHSGKDAQLGDEIQTSDLASSGVGSETREAGRRRRRHRRRGSGSRSLSELEFEELKGFMDLGFTFSDAEADPRLMSIVPGLQRLRAVAVSDGGSPAGVSVSPSSGSGGTADDTAVPRPYLSEAWDAAEEAAELDRLRNWRIPAAGEGVDMKDHLRYWAHMVASAVR